MNTRQTASVTATITMAPIGNEIPRIRERLMGGFGPPAPTEGARQLHDSFAA